MIRIAAVGDVHYGQDSSGRLKPHLENIEERADLLLLAGDLTRRGEPAEAALLAADLRGLELPRIAVLGNHDYHAGKPNEVRKVLEEAGVTVLEGETAVHEVDGLRVGLAGVKGFGGGFWGACGSDFGEPEMKAFVHYTKSEADKIHRALLDFRSAEYRIAL